MIPIVPETVVQDLDERIEEEEVIAEILEPVVIPQTPPPIPSFIPLPQFPKIIPVKTIIASTPAPFVPAPLPVKPVPLPEVQSRSFATTTKSPNEYLPPFDVRSGDVIDFSSWKVKKLKISFTNHI